MQRQLSTCQLFKDLSAKCQICQDLTKLIDVSLGTWLSKWNIQRFTVKMSYVKI